MRCYLMRDKKIYICVTIHYWARYVITEGVWVLHVGVKKVKFLVDIAFALRPAAMHLHYPLCLHVIINKWKQFVFYCCVILKPARIVLYLQKVESDACSNASTYVDCWHWQWQWKFIVCRPLLTAPLFISWLRDLICLTVIRFKQFVREICFN